MKIRHLVFSILSAFCLACLGVQQSQLTEDQKDIQTLATIIHAVVVNDVINTPPDENA